MLSNERIFAVIPTSNLERARRFYGETLRLEETENGHQKDKLDRGRVSFEGAQGTMLLVYQPEAPANPKHTVAGWMVDDIDEAVDELTDRGVEFEDYSERMPDIDWDERGVGTSASNRSAWFRDPDGNLLVINEMRS